MNCQIPAASTFEIALGLKLDSRKGIDKISFGRRNNSICAFKKGR